MDLIGAFDQSMSLTLAFILPHYFFLDFIFRLLSFEGATTIMWVALIIIVFTWEFYIRNNKEVFLAQFTKLIITLTVTLVIASASVHFIIKPLIHRDRPYVEYGMSAPYCPNDFSFPSGHATAAFAGAYILSKFDHNRRRRVVYALLALGVSYSRIYLLCHYGGDVLAGALYGLAVAAIMYETIHRMYRKNNKTSMRNVK